MKIRHPILIPSLLLFSELSMSVDDNGYHCHPPGVLLKQPSAKER